MKTTLECLIAAALSTDANTLGNNSGAKYTNRFVFADGKYSFEAHCLDDENIWLELCEVDEEESSKVLIGHCLHVMHNPEFAPIFAYFLWADFERLLHTNSDLSHIDKEEFALALLNGREYALVDSANSTIEEVFRGVQNVYEKRGSEHFFMSRLGVIWLNQDCLEFYAEAGALKALPEDIRKSVDEAANVAKPNKNSANAYSECLEYFKDKHWDSTVEAAKDIYNWQAQRGISFCLQTLALLFSELGVYEHFEFADDLLRDEYTCSVLIEAFVSPYSYIK